MIRFTYEGEAVGKGRPRATGRGKYITLYTSKKTKDFEEGVRNAFLEVVTQNGDALKKPLYARERALEVKLSIYTIVPKSYSLKRRKRCLANIETPTKKPDIDNIVKSVLDALNGYAYEDDSQVIKIYAEKFYAERAYMEVEISEWTKNTAS